MKRNVLKLLILAGCILTVYGCLDPYTPKGTTTDVHYLVVDGFFNTKGVTQVRLSRSSIISSEAVSQSETGATVTIESQNGTQYALTGDHAGNYTLPAVVADLSQKYKLKITTSDNTSYASAFIEVKEAPVIDTVRWEVTGEDLQFYLSAHDDLANSRYYRWRYTETWKYNSQFASEYIFENKEMVPRPNPFEFYYCWSSENSGQILIWSSAKLATDIISDFPFRKLNIHDLKFQTRYSLLVEQYALTREGYDYWEQLRKSTETNGSIFDPQPSQAPSNIQNLSDPTNPVIGFFGAGSVQTKRIFIQRNELPDVHRLTGYEGCVADTLKVEGVADYNGGKMVASAIAAPHGAAIIAYTLATPSCVDCRYHGGSTTPPDFW